MKTINTTFRNTNKKYYHAVHDWLRIHHGSADKCSQKGCDGLYGRYEWALLDGYTYEKKIENFSKMCIPCHRRYDGIIEKMIAAHKKPVIGIFGDVIIKADSTTQASKITGISKTAINNALRKVSTNAGGYKWLYAK